jgi:two-component system, NtrC family, response regulator AtoC
MPELKIFVVDDDMPTAKMLFYNLSQNKNNHVSIFTSGHDCLSNLYKKPDVVALDYYLSGEDCESIIDKIQEHDSGIYIIIVSGQQDVATAVKLMKMGIHDYIVKDVHHKTALNKAIDKIRSNIEIERMNCEKA